MQEMIGIGWLGLGNDSLESGTNAGKTAQNCTIIPEGVPCPAKNGSIYPSQASNGRNMHKCID